MHKIYELMDVIKVMMYEISILMDNECFVV